MLSGGPVVFLPVWRWHPALSLLQWNSYHWYTKDRILHLSFPFNVISLCRERNKWWVECYFTNKFPESTKEEAAGSCLVHRPVTHKPISEWMGNDGFGAESHWLEKYYWYLPLQGTWGQGGWVECLPDSQRGDRASGVGRAMEASSCILLSQGVWRLNLFHSKDVPPHIFQTLLLSIPLSCLVFSKMQGLHACIFHLN